MASLAALTARLSLSSRPALRQPSPPNVRNVAVRRHTPPSAILLSPRLFSTTCSRSATLNQVLRGCRTGKRARRPVSPQMSGRPHMKGVCLKVGITKPKKPNSGERKTARVKLSNGTAVTAYIPGEGHNIQQHSVVLVRGGRSQDCPGVKYKLVRGALDLVSWPSARHGDAPLTIIRAVLLAA